VAELDRLSAPDTVDHGVAYHASQTTTDLSKFLEPIKVTEQFTPAEQAAGLWKLLAVGLGLSALVTVGLAAMLKPSFEVGATIYTGFALIFTLALHWRHTAYSQIGLAFKRQRYQRDVVLKLIDSNEAISLEKLANEDRAHERRSKKADRYLDILEGKHNGH